jgi:DNA-binding transcriptional MerR regulator
VDKSPDAFRTISEAAIDLDLPQHVLRFWETRFSQIKPLKRGGGRRYYRPDDVDLLKGIRHLLYGEGYTIRGVQRILKEQGVRFVMNVWREGAPQPPPSGGAGALHRGDRAEPDFEEDYDDEAAAEAAEPPPDDAYSPYAPHHVVPVARPREADDADFAVPMVRSGETEPPLQPPMSAEARHSGDEAAGAAALAQRFAPRFAPVGDAEPTGDVEDRPAAAMSRATPRPIEEPRFGGSVEGTRSPIEDVAPARNGGARVAPAVAAEAKEGGRPGLGQFLDRLRPGHGHGPGRDVETAAARPGRSLSRDEIRRLQSTLFELLECKRLLDQVR